MSPDCVVESYFVSAIGTRLLRSVRFSNDDNDAGFISKLGTEILENDIIVE